LGIEAQWTQSPDALRAKALKPANHGPADLEKLGMPVVTYDEQESGRCLALAQAPRIDP
jgi:hypothetical protein